MKRISLNLRKTFDASYEVEIERGLLKRLASDLRMRKYCDHYVVISDERVNRLYAGELIASLKREGLYLGKIVVPSGEKSKSFSQFQRILEKMIDLGANRTTGVLAFGGGVVGDLGGFVAASFMRGIPLVQVPTTLLAMVDSSVGGKVAIDLESGKNLVGAFWQPKKVYIDPDVLKTLSQKQWKSGLSEAVKYAAIKDRGLWEFFEQYIDLWKKKPSEFLPSDLAHIEEMISRCVQIKADVVMQDEKEENVRQILNYGHTFGHVIELMSDYSVLHGEAVATGMRLAAALSEALRIMPAHERERQDALFDALGMGKTKSKGLISDFIRHMKKDKKAKGGLRGVLVSRLGYCHQQMGKYGIPLDEKVLKKVLLDSGLIDDEKAVSSEISSPSSWSPSPPGSSISASLCSSSSSADETDLQRRLRLMRERRDQRMQEGNDGGLGNAGFLPG